MAVKSAQLIIILGSPASGKTTLARRLGARLSLPCLCKDDVKEALFDGLSIGNRAWSRRLSEASFIALERLARTQLELGQSCIVEGNWRAPHAASLSAIASSSGARAAQILCRADPDEILRRFVARSRHPGHLDRDWSPAELEHNAERSGDFLDLDGPRWLVADVSHTAYEHLVEALKTWRL